MSGIKKKAAELKNDLNMRDEELKFLMDESDIKLHTIRSRIADLSMELQKLKAEEKAEKEMNEWFKLLKSVDSDNIVSMTEDQCSRLSIRTNELKYVPGKKSIADVFK